jgi:hypothetical protein
MPAKDEFPEFPATRRLWRALTKTGLTHHQRRRVVETLTHKLNESEMAEFAAAAQVGAE